MYSYFIMWRDSDYNLCRVNICTGYELDNQPYSKLEDLVRERLRELKLPCDFGPSPSLRVFLDLVHNDPVIWSQHTPKGANKLAGEFPGRHIYSPNWRER